MLFRSQHRNVGLVVETRPDHVHAEEIRWMRALGVTKVQMGAQSLDDNILEQNQRGHTVAQTRAAVTLLRAAVAKEIQVRYQKGCDVAPEGIAAVAQIPRLPNKWGRMYATKSPVLCGCGHPEFLTCERLCHQVDCYLYLTGTKFVWRG